MIEVMISLGITTVGLLGALAMLGTLFRGATYSRNVSEAMALVQSKLEIEVSRGPISATVPTSAATSESAMDSLGRITGSGPFLYTRTTTWAPSSDNLRRKVSVSVVFNDGSGVAHTLLAERERNLP